MEEPEPADAPSVWSDSDKEDDSVMLSVAAGSALAVAVMGAASNLVAM